MASMARPRAHVGSLGAELRLQQRLHAGARSGQPELLAARQHVAPQAWVLDQLSHAEARASRSHSRERIRRAGRARKGRGRARTG